MAPPQFADSVIQVGRDVVGLVSRAAEEQGGIISGDNPTVFKASAAMRVWVIQLIIIICTTQLLSLILARIRQPRVIAEVIGGVILGPTVMGRIPNFSQTIFPPESLPYLNLTATIGLVLFLFLVGLELDVRILKRNAKYSFFISLAGLILPFGLGSAVAVPIYHQFINPKVDFGLFLLFVGVAIAITAFPVLCRILTELNLLDTHVGIVTLSAGSGDDVVGWVLLALTVALANASPGLTALYVLIASTAWTLFMLFPVRWAFLWLAKRTGSLENSNPSFFMMTVTILLVFISAFMTDILGVHAIFGGFLAGLVIPHEGGYAIALVEKLEDLVSLVFLPLYFTLSGLRTNLGLLDTGLAWGYIILICTIAFFGKFVGCSIAARLCKFTIRESAAIGVLMSCKGLVELIVLNIGLQAGILDTRVFSMFVVHALVLTFMTTPLAIFVYPPEHRLHLAPGSKRPSEMGDPEIKHPTSKIGDSEWKSSLSLVLNKVEHLPAIMALMQLLQPAPIVSTDSASTPEPKEKRSIKIVVPTDNSSTPEPKERRNVKIDGLRLVELTARTSAVMRSSEAEELLRRDTLISVFRTFGHFNRLPVTASLSVVTEEAFSSSVVKHVEDNASDLVIIPWSSHTSDAVSTINEHTTTSPFDGLFGKSAPEQPSAVVYSHFIRRVFHDCPVDVGLFVDRGIPSTGGRHGSYGHHVFLPFFGGPDDRLALSFVVQLCTNSATTATVLRVRRTEHLELTSQTTEDTGKADLVGIANASGQTAQSATNFPDTLYPHASTEHRMVSETADNLAWERLTSPTLHDLPPTTQEALTRITFTDLSSPRPLQAVLRAAAEQTKRTSESWKSMLVIVGRGRKMAVENHQAELKQIVAEHEASPASAEISRTMGDVAAAFATGSVNAGLIVMQAAAAV